MSPDQAVDDLVRAFNLALSDNNRGFDVGINDS